MSKGDFQEQGCSGGVTDCIPTGMFCSVFRGRPAIDVRRICRYIVCRLGELVKEFPGYEHLHFCTVRSLPLAPKNALLDCGALLASLSASYLISTINP